MILATLDELVRYQPMSARIHNALAWLADTDWAALEEGRHEGPLSAAGESPYYATISKYATKVQDECRYEAHRAYIDVQVLLRGEEYIDACPIVDLAVAEPYSAGKDIEFFQQPAAAPRGCRILLKPGIAAVFFPEDAHRPCIATGRGTGEVRKLVVKIRIPETGAR